MSCVFYSLEYKVHDAISVDGDATLESLEGDGVVYEN